MRASPLEARTPQTVTDPRMLLETVRQARVQGWCLVNQELEEGLVSMAAPVTGRGGKVLAAINISGQANRTDAAVMRQTLLGPLRETAEAISAQLATRG